MTAIKRLKIFSRNMLRLAGLVLLVLTAAGGLTSCRLLGRPSEAEVGAEYLRQTLEALPDYPTTTPQPPAPPPPPPPRAHRS
jgi:hypothetical protein